MSRLRTEVYRKLVHITLSLLLLTPLFFEKTFHALAGLTPGQAYALAAFSTMLFNAFQIKKPIVRETMVKDLEKILQAFRNEVSRLSGSAPSLAALMETLEKAAAFVEHNVMRQISLLERSYERKSGYVGLTMGSIGALIGYMLAGRHVCYGLIALLTVDPAGALVGGRFGRHKIPFSKGTWEGSAAGFVAVVLTFMLLTEPSKAIILSAVAVLSELYGIEDNLTMPVAVSLAALLLNTGPGACMLR